MSWHSNHQLSMKLYIRSTGNISPQPSFGTSALPAEPTEYSGNRLRCIEPVYANFIDAKLIRRMSRVIRMGVTAALECMRQGGVSIPDGIITGTAYGCMEDTEVFLSRMVENKEELLTPTAFIQSTHNTVGAQIALLLKCHQYNNTFVHRGLSFESALLDAYMLLQEKNMEHILVGAVDEITDTSHSLLQRFGLYKSALPSNLALFENHSRGTLNGEGAAFFLLSGDAGSHSLAVLEDMQTFCNPEGPGGMEAHIVSFLETHALAMRDIDLVITGRNGDPRSDKLYDRLDHQLFQPLPAIPFKHLCGEYPTGSAFAVWLAAMLLSKGSAPAWLLAGRQAPTQTLHRILICNHYLQRYHSLFLLSAC